jgi:cytochrome c oxidase subunit IV
MGISDKNGKSPTSSEVFTLPLVKEGPLHGPEVAPARPAHGGHGGHGGHGHGGPDHVPHVLPLWIYLATWGTLMVLTVVTVLASYVDLGAANLPLALLIATLKASVVALMFMHLRWDHKFHAIIFSFSIIFLGIFIAFTMFDTETRGQADAVQRDRPVNVRTPFRQTQLDGKEEMKLKQQFGLDPRAPIEPPQLAPPD